MTESPSEVARQRAYYAQTASDYAAHHQIAGSPHDRSIEIIADLLSSAPPSSMLDVGAGTGRAVRAFTSRFFEADVRGLEPVSELINEAEAAGVRAGAIVVGDANQLPFADKSIDVVTAFGVLHHVKRPEVVIAEMFRVAKRAVFISDSNRYAQGRGIARIAKTALSVSGLWPAFDFIRTRGRGYMVSEGDGVYYSYSVFDSLPLMRTRSKSLMLAEVERSSVAAGPYRLPLWNATTLLVGAFLE